MVVVGTDVHVGNSFLVATDRDGRRLAKGRRANTPAELAEFCDHVLAAVGGRLQPMDVVLESTTNSRAIQRTITQGGRRMGWTPRRRWSTLASCGSTPRASASVIRSTLGCSTNWLDPS